MGERRSVIQQCLTRTRYYARTKYKIKYKVYERAAQGPPRVALARSSLPVFCTRASLRLPLAPSCDYVARATNRLKIITLT